MSRLIKKPIMITGGASVAEANGVLTVKGPKGEQKVTVPAGVKVAIKGDEVMVEFSNKDERNAIAGTVWSLTKNALEGVTTGFVKVLEIEGVGYRAVLEGKELVLFLGYALPVRLPIPDGITVAVEKSVLKVSGIVKEEVGQMAAEIRALKKPEPYKGKGIRYQGEIVQRKVGKKAGTGTAA